MERDWPGAADLVEIAAAAEAVGAFEPQGWSALLAVLHDFPAWNDWWTGLRDLATITGAIDDGGAAAAMQEEPSDGPTTEPTTRLERSGDVWRVVA